MAEPFLPVADLIARAKAGPALALTNETFQSFPVPVRRPDGLRLAFLYGRCKLIPGPGRLLFPPQYVAFLAADTGVLELMRELAPGEIGPRANPDEPLGEHTIGRGLSRSEFNDRRGRLYAAFDELLAAFAAGRITESTRRAGAQFVALFDCLGEAPLQPFREAAGAEFYAWLYSFTPRGVR